MSDNCARCQRELTAETRSRYGRICRPCVAEMKLAGDGARIEDLDRVLEERAAGRIPRRGEECGRCGTPVSYDPEARQRAYLCDDCGKPCCMECLARCLIAFETPEGHVENNADRILCKDCRAARVLANFKVTEIPWQEASP